MTSLQARTLSRAAVAASDASRLERLGRYAGVKLSVCLAVDNDAGLLTGIAGFGVPGDDVDLFSWPLTDTRDPLVATLSAANPVVFRPGKVNGHVGRVTPTTPL